jgi:hypothetical protein
MPIFFDSRFHPFYPLLVYLLFSPGRFREEATDVGFIGTFQKAAGYVGHTLVLQDDQPGQVISEMVELPTISETTLKFIAVFQHYWGWLDYGQLHSILSWSNL